MASSNHDDVENILIEKSTDIDAVVNQQSTNEYESWQLPEVDNTSFDSDIYGNKIGSFSQHSQKLPSVTELENIRSEAEKEGVAQGKDQGYQQGFDSGQQQGFEQGLTEGRIQGLTQGLAELGEIIEQFNQPLKLLDNNIEQQLLSLVISMVKAVVKQELVIEPSHILFVLRDGLAALPMQSQAISIHLHPDDISIIENAFSQTEIQKNNWQLVENSTLAKGGCVIDTQHSEVDMTLETRLSKTLAHCLATKSEFSTSVDNDLTTNNTETPDVNNSDTNNPDIEIIDDNNPRSVHFQKRATEPDYLDIEEGSINEDSVSSTSAENHSDAPHSDDDNSDVGNDGDNY